jgi:hypothetical protein
MYELTMKSLARIHWEKHRPKMVAHLKANKIYEAALKHNARIASDVLSSKLSLGADLETAKKYVLKTWIFLPDEKTEPLLDPDLMPFSQPGENMISVQPPKIPGKARIASERVTNSHH